MRLLVLEDRLDRLPVGYPGRNHLVVDMMLMSKLEYGQAEIPEVFYGRKFVG